MTNRMDAVDHTHPAQDAVAGAYRRGLSDDDGLRADGGGSEVSDAEADAETEASRMRDVSHTSADGTNDVWTRGETDEVRDDDE